MTTALGSNRVHTFKENSVNRFRNKIDDVPSAIFTDEEKRFLIHSISGNAGFYASIGTKPELLEKAKRLNEWYFQKLKKHGYDAARVIGMTGQQKSEIRKVTDHSKTEVIFEHLKRIIFFEFLKNIPELSELKGMQLCFTSPYDRLSTGLDFIMTFKEEDGSDAYAGIQTFLWNAQNYKKPVVQESFICREYEESRKLRGLPMPRLDFFLEPNILYRLMKKHCDRASVGIEVTKEMQGYFFEKSLKEEYGFKQSVEKVQGNIEKRVGQLLIHSRAQSLKTQPFKDCDFN